MRNPERLTAATIQRLRLTPGASVELYITDRCPVGCAHCSVDALPARARPDLELLRRLVDGITGLDGLKEVGISGGEPFAVPDALKLAVDRLKDHAQLVLYTSGFWAQAKRLPTWIPDILRSVDTVFLSTDRYHLEQLPWDVVCSAARTVIDSGAWLVIQIIDEGDALAEAAQQIGDHFGDSFTEVMEFNPTQLLYAGRAEHLRERSEGPVPLDRNFGACGLLYAPVVRYDGRVTACCNEGVIMGGGPRRLHGAVSNASDLTARIHGFRDDPFLTALRSPVAGVRALERLLPDPNGGAAKPYRSICQACAALNSRLPLQGTVPQNLVSVAAVCAKLESKAADRWAARGTVPNKTV